MALTAAELQAEVRAAIGRTNDTDLITDARIIRWLNEAQRTVAERIPGILQLRFKNTTSLDFTEQLVYNLSDVTTVDPTTTNNICHLYGLKFLDGQESRNLLFTHTDEFDNAWPDPTHPDIPAGKPRNWTRRGDTVEIMPISQCSYWDKDMRFDGDRYPVDLTVDSTEISEIPDSDEGLTEYAIARAWNYIGDQGKSSIHDLKFSNPMPNTEQKIGWLEKYKDQNDSLHAWDGNLYSDGMLGYYSYGD
jgi:hypothetical protein